MRLIRSAIIIAFAGVAVAACGSDTSSGQTLNGKKFTVETGTRAVTVDMVDNNFQPEYVTVRAGTKVTFLNRGHNRHNVFSVDDRFTSSGFLGRDDSWKVTFADVGDFPLYCSLHGTATSGMIGGIRVVK